MQAVRRTADVGLQGGAQSFEALFVPDSLVAGLHAAGWTVPSPVQQASIPKGRSGADLIVQAKSGTGKTVAFGVIALERVDLTCPHPQVLIISPTREIALQSAEVINTIGACLPATRLTVGVFIGGLPAEEDRKLLRRACHVAVGTPGRLCALLESGALLPDKIKVVVLDEADSLFGEGFHDDVGWLLGVLPPSKQVLAFSATYTPEAMEGLQGWLLDPLRVMLAPDTVSLTGVRQFYRIIEGVDPRARGAFAAKAAALLDMFSLVSFSQAVIFCNSKLDAQWLTDHLKEQGFKAAFLSGAQAQTDRIDTITALRDFRLRIVVSTDLVARGVDLERVNVVANLDLPSDASTYMHRVGRTGRYGTHGIAVTFVTPEELGTLQGYLAGHSGAQISPLPDDIPDEYYARRPEDDAEVSGTTAPVAEPEAHGAAAGKAAGAADAASGASPPPPPPNVPWLDNPWGPYTRQGAPDPWDDFAQGLVVDGSLTEQQHEGQALRHTRSDAAAPAGRCADLPAPTIQTVGTQQECSRGGASAPSGQSRQGGGQRRRSPAAAGRDAEQDLEDAILARHQEAAELAAEQAQAEQAQGQAGDERDDAAAQERHRRAPGAPSGHDAWQQHSAAWEQSLAALPEGQLVQVPAALLGRYWQLEMADWHRRYEQWLHAYNTYYAMQSSS